MYGQMMGKRKMDGMGRMGPEVETVEFTPPKELKLEGESGTPWLTGVPRRVAPLKSSDSMASPSVNPVVRTWRKMP